MKAHLQKTIICREKLWLFPVLSPVDIISDSIPGVGYLDDAAIVTACWKLVKSDVEEYKRWRQMNGKVI